MGHNVLADCGSTRRLNAIAFQLSFELIIHTLDYVILGWSLVTSMAKRVSATGERTTDKVCLKTKHLLQIMLIVGRAKTAATNAGTLEVS